MATRVGIVLLTIGGAVPLVLALGVGDSRMLLSGCVLLGPALIAVSIVDRTPEPPEGESIETCGWPRVD